MYIVNTNNNFNLFYLILRELRFFNKNEILQNPKQILQIIYMELTTIKN